ncbi:hypothetical protein P692DRAFT_20870818 [Suillus brevipes Sb2]|nr:hypothetical protein P692DRAFT_20870818 [Suillus brevipes Sb2]
MQVKIEELAEKFQEFYLELEGDVRVEIEKEKGEASEEEHGFRAKEVVELVEGTLSTLFYDRLFLPSNSDNALHDEALSSHIAALNLLIYASLQLPIVSLIEALGNALDAEFKLFLSTILEPGTRDLLEFKAAEISVPAEAAKLAVNQQHVKQTWDASSVSTREDWTEWMWS